MKIKLTKGLVTRDEALKISPAYVAFVEQHKFDDALLHPFYWDFENTDQWGYPTCGIKKGQQLLTYVDGQYVSVKVTSVVNPKHDADGPTVRVGNGEYTWRVDGDKYGVRIG